MAYNQDNYGQQGQQGYGSYNPYGQSANPYGQQQGNPYGQQQQQPYGHSGNYSERPDLDHHSSSRYDEEAAPGGSYEMSSMGGRDPNRILNEVRNLDRSVDEVEAKLQQLKGLHLSYLDTTDTSRDNPTRIQINNMAEDLGAKFRGLVGRARTLKSDPESGNPRNKAQVGKIDRRIKATMTQYQKIDSEYRQKSQERMTREYLIVRPDASDAEIREAIDAGGEQVFSQALIQSDRRGQAQSAARNVQTRHEDIQRIEKQMTELAQLFNDMEQLVVQQEPAVQQIEEKGEEATQHVGQANQQLDVAVKKARSARRKKWWCLGIVALIIIIIVIVVVVVVEVNKGKR